MEVVRVMLRKGQGTAKRRDGATDAITHAGTRAVSAALDALFSRLRFFEFRQIRRSQTTEQGSNPATHSKQKELPLRTERRRSIRDNDVGNGAVRIGSSGSLWVLRGLPLPVARYSSSIPADAIVTPLATVDASMSVCCSRVCWTRCCFSGFWLRPQPQLAWSSYISCSLDPAMSLPPA